MGQYYVVVNLDKKEFIRPHYMGDGAKLLEFGCSATGTMAGLAVLLATSNGKGGGDLQNVPEGNVIVGRWKGDRIAIVGDYDDSPEYKGLYTKCGKEEDGWVDISFPTMETMMNDPYIRADIIKNDWYRGIWNANHPQKRPFPTK